MTKLKSLPARPSFESLRKQAKKLQREVTADHPDALARARAQLAAAALPLSQRDAQFVLAREYGVAGWHELKAEVLERTGQWLAWTARQAQRAIHDDDLDRLQQLLTERPALLSFRDETGATGLLPRTLRTLAALGDLEGVRVHVEAADRAERNEACMDACAFGHPEIAALLLQHCIELDPELARRIDTGPGHGPFIAYLSEHDGRFGAQGDIWQAFVMSQVTSAIDASDAAGFTGWLQREPWLLGEFSIALQIEWLQYATAAGRESFIRLLLNAQPALLQAPRASPSAAIEYAFEYGHAGFVPLLARVWNVPDDLPHAAGAGDFERVKRWVAADGGLALGDPARHYPLNNPRKLGHLHWSAGEAQHVLDTALAWACLNHHFAIADFLLDRGANVDTDWGTHEPASILHECAIHGNYPAAKFLIERGIDMTTHDYRWQATAEGWARHAAHDEAMATLLAEAARAREPR